MSIKSFTIEDVRCFAGKHEFNISPITFIVGENSTGKSTVLGCLQTLGNFAQQIDLDFNVEPYQMGAFTDIVRKSRPQKKKFKLGMKFKDRQEQDLEYSLTLVETDKGSEPVIQQQSLISSNGDQLVIKLQDTKGSRTQRDSARDSTQDSIRAYDLGIISVEERSLGEERDALVVTVKKQFMDQPHAFSILIGYDEHVGFFGKKGRINKFIKNKFSDPRIPLLRFMPEMYSFAPIRSNPKRTYDSVKMRFSPEGSDMPMVLMNMSGSKKSAWDTLKKQLIEFGKNSGLFTGIDIRNLGNKSDPFQVQIKVRGPKANLMDVGYGVSQILPILVRIFNTHQKTTFLMQQPEVHLHPKGQAEFSSLLVKLAKQNKHNFIIETHSDYMIDRARIEIIRDNIEPKDVSLIYLEPVGNKVKAHNINFDKQGNILGAPNGYRDFFLKESDKLLGFS